MRNRQVTCDKRQARRRKFRWSLVACRLSLAAVALVACRMSLVAISDNAGTKNGNFLKIATDARGVALGDTIVSMVQGADAMRWNPAALGEAEGKEVSAT